MMHEVEAVDPPLQHLVSSHALCGRGDDVVRHRRLDHGRASNELRVHVTRQIVALQNNLDHFIKFVPTLRHREHATIPRPLGPKVRICMEGLAKYVFSAAPQCSFDSCFVTTDITKSSSNT